ncbi:hypothetical protein F5882DRAFT_172339 [Hyaloscypha sp. PMI_1271]|nr:hypothetical protein F5882DRAFT_172339 [Hyaloscypha sp. PMI_1271]
MDPLSIVSLVGTIVQFVDFGGKLLSNAVELYRSPVGKLAAHHELELVTTDLQALISKLRQSFYSRDEPPTQDTASLRQSFEVLCDEAVKVAQELVNRLEKLKVKDGKLRTWHSLQHAVEAAWSRNELVDLKNQLLGLKNALETRVLFSIRETLDVHSIQASARFDNLDQNTQEILRLMLRRPADITTEVSEALRNQMTAQTTTLTQVLSRVEASNKDNHHQTRDTIVQCIKEEKRKTIENSQRWKRGQPVEVTDTVPCSCAQLRVRHKATEETMPSDTSEITAGIEMLNVSKSAESKLRSDVYLEICSSLQYPTMTHRYEDVLEAYPETFEWAFHDPTKEQLPWDNLAHWLEQSHGIYWVNGKAGSGKSTFMKHLYDDRRTRKYLKTWAGNAPLCVASFFFWNSGSREQKSQIGLLRSLLFQLFSQHPNLIPIVLPELWAKTYSNAVNQMYPGEDFARFWSLQ